MRQHQVIRRMEPEHYDLPLVLQKVTRRVLANRGILSEADLDFSLAGLLTTEQFTGIFDAADVIVNIANIGGNILVVGDFDTDGATSTALALKSLSAMGIENADFLVPNRFEFGYGLSPELVDVAHRDKNPDLIITVDNGISSIEGVRRAKELGIKVVVTDHHLPGKELPEAEAIVNPCIEHNCFQSPNLAGVGVVFYLMGALRARLKDKGWFEEQSLEVPKLATYLDLVALGTVADLVVLDENNRRLVHAGLKLIKTGRGNAGITALLQQAGRDISSLTTSDLAFTVAPRLNAAGRMRDMSLGIECLLEDDARKCLVAAKELSLLNKERRLVEHNMREEALSIAKEIIFKYNTESLPIAFSLYRENWHQGVVGIVASRIKDVFHRPTIIFANGNGKELKGSARSIKGLHIRDVLATIASRRPGLISRFGGHAMAAGLSITKEDLNEFNEALEEVVGEQLDKNCLQASVFTDGELEPVDFNLELAKELELVFPWGQGFPEPTFDGVFDIIESKVVGENHMRLVLSMPELDQHLPAIAFNASEQGWCAKGLRVKIVFQLKTNKYNNKETFQLLVLHGMTS